MQWLKTQIEQTPNWECLAPVPLQTACVRLTPPGLSGEALDRHTLAWVDRINRGGQAYLTPAQLDGSWMVRVSIGSEKTTFSDVQQLWSLMQKEAEQENP